MDIVKGVGDLLKYWGVLLSLQVALLVLNGYVIMSADHKANFWTLTAMVFVLHVLILQVTRRRYMALRPWNGFVQHESASLDTYYLRAIIFAATFLTLIGLVGTFVPEAEHWLWDQDVSGGWQIALVAVAIAFLLLIPTLGWLLGGSIDINSRIATKLRTHHYLGAVNCPYCQKYRGAQLLRYIMDKHNGIETVDCRFCNTNESFDVRLNVGEILGSHALPQ